MANLYCEETLKYALKGVKIHQLKHIKTFKLLVQAEIVELNAFVDFCSQAITSNFANLRRLDLVFEQSGSFSNEALQLLCSQLSRHLKNLERLKLEIWEGGDVDDEGFRAFLFEIEHLSRLKDLTFLLNESKISNKSLEILKPILSQSMFKLKNLSLSFRGCTGLTDTGLRSLGEGVTTIESLRQLELCLMNCKRITDAGLKALTSKIFECSNSLVSLNFDFSYISVKKINVTRKNFDQLKELSLNLTGCEKFHSKSLNELGKELFPAIPNLEKLDLKFSRCSQILETDLILLFSSIGESLKKLTHLSLDFSWCKITGMALEQIGINLSLGLTQLLKLKLSFDGCTITDADIEDFGSKISSISGKLLKLSLNFGACEITGKGLRFLTASDRDNWSHVQSLRLNLSGRGNVNNESVEVITTSISEKLTGLTALRLNFSGCNKIHNEALNLIMSAVKKLTKLQKLHLLFYACEGIDSEGIQALVFNLETYGTSLRKLYLHFGVASGIKRQPEIQEEDIKQMLKFIPDLRICL